MKLHFHPEASQEIDKSAQNYEGKAEGLGVEFLYELRQVLQLIEDNPRIGKPFEDTERILFLNKFPYGVIYEIVDNSYIDVYAIKHQHRRPGYWKHRK